MKKLISLVSLFCLSVFLPLSVMGEPIDREAVVKRHRVCTTGTLLKSPAQVGNGKFAFGMDITGLQTFVPFNTLSDWSWHSFPLPEGMRAEDYRPVVVETHGKKIAYELRNPDQPELSEWLTKNPHRAITWAVSVSVYCVKTVRKRGKLTWAMPGRKSICGQVLSIAVSN